MHVLRLLLEDTPAAPHRLHDPGGMVGMDMDPYLSARATTIRLSPNGSSSARIPPDRGGRASGRSPCSSGNVRLSSDAECRAQRRGSRRDRGFQRAGAVPVVRKSRTPRTKCRTLRPRVHTADFFSIAQFLRGCCLTDFSTAGSDLSNSSRNDRRIPDVLDEGAGPVADRREDGAFAGAADGS